MINTFSSNRWIVWLSHAAMSTHLAFSRAQKAGAAYKCALPFSLSFSLGLGVDGTTASANVGESKVTREKKRRGKVGKDEPPWPPPRPVHAWWVMLFSHHQQHTVAELSRERMRALSNGNITRNIETRTLTKEQETHANTRGLIRRPDEPTSNVRENKEMPMIEWSCAIKGNANITVESRANF